MHTVHTVMPLTTLRVHIAPVGYEIDRIVIPAKKMKADKVWLLVHDKPSEDKAIKFQEKIQDQLKKQRIKVVIKHHNRLDLFNIIRSIKEIFTAESGNDVFVNLASGSKIQAIASMMACMMFRNMTNIKPFYAEAEHYPGFEGKKPISTGVKSLTEIPTYQIHVPKPELIHALKLIKEHNGKLTKKKMAELAQENKIITINAREENLTQARYASLDKNIIKPLEDQWKFIDVEKIGRNHWIKITQEGINASEFLI